MLELYSFIDFLKTNAALIIAFFSLCVSGYSVIINKRKFRIESIAYERDISLGMEKLRELVYIARKIKNINPKAVTVENFLFDKELFYSIFRYYESNEEKIIKCSHAIPQIITMLKRTVTILESNFNGIAVHNDLELNEEKIWNYKLVFSHMQRLCLILENLNNKEQLYGDDSFQYFFEKYWSFSDYINVLLSKQMQSLINGLKEAKNSYFKHLQLEKGTATY